MLYFVPPVEVSIVFEQIDDNPLTAEMSRGFQFVVLEKFWTLCWIADIGTTINSARAATLIPFNSSKCPLWVKSRQTTCPL